MAGQLRIINVDYIGKQQCYMMEAGAGKSREVTTFCDDNGDGILDRELDDTSFVIIPARWQAWRDYGVAAQQLVTLFRSTLIEEINSSIAMSGKIQFQNPFDSKYIIKETLCPTNAGGKSQVSTGTARGIAGIFAADFNGDGLTDEVSFTTRNKVEVHISSESQDIDLREHYCTRLDLARRYVGKYLKPFDALK